MQRAVDAGGHKKEEDPKVIQERKEAKEDISKRLFSSVLEMAELKSHLEYMLIAVMGTLIFLSCIMVRIFSHPWLFRDTDGLSDWHRVFGWRTLGRRLQ